ncbi:hypothetical protein HHK36_021382 [Tetracentron sinense]|uniref:Pre-mRNA-splicing factor RBM22 n=1 Tax=Tetracentron sinense TaxID=13715 RepID=A0A834YWV8_TETSI|nr:hypothetical protein HHK36_021382 [Tetracentron sinense]
MPERKKREEFHALWSKRDCREVWSLTIERRRKMKKTRAAYGKQCKICTRPFTILSWRPGHGARFKKTEICLTCSEMKNVCQVCILDLQYGLPVQVRDTALSISSNDSIPVSGVNREYFTEELDRRARAGLDNEPSYGKISPNGAILKFQRPAPYYTRNQPHVCSFYKKGECTRGAECPYRHEMPTTGELSQQNIKDRYYGVNDRVALKILNKAGQMPSLVAPEDKSIKTLNVCGLNASMTEQDLRDYFYSHGEIESIRMVLHRACAFVTYTTREDAEKAAEQLSNKLVIKGQRLKLRWGLPQAQRQPSGPPSMHHFKFPHPPQPEHAFYPSMDTQRMGALFPSQGSH